MKTLLFSTILLLFSTALQALDIRSIKLAAELGDANAQFNLGNIYSFGEGDIEDDKLAVEWYTKAAKQGHTGAQYNLGVMYDNGEGVIEDYKLAVEWYTKAAMQGFAKAQLNLGVMYYNGEGVIQDFVASYAWISNAKANGNKDSSKVISILKGKMTKEQIALGQALATKLYQQIENRDDESPVHTKYD